MPEGRELLILCFPAHASGSLQNLDCLQPVTATLAESWEAGEPPTAASTVTATSQAGTHPSRLPSAPSGARTGRPAGGFFGRGTPCTSCCWHTTGTRTQEQAAQRYCCTDSDPRFAWQPQHRATSAGSRDSTQQQQGAQE